MIGAWDNARTLLPGVVVSLAEPNEPGRVEASSGTIAASAADGDYDAGAIIPTCAWQGLSRTDRKTLIESDMARADGAAIRIVRPGSEILHPFRELQDLARHCSLDEVRREVSRPVFAKAMRLCAESARDRFGVRVADELGQIAGGIRVNTGNLRTVTVHPQTGKFVGLHVDNWSLLPLSQRHLAPQRICINLGAEPRYLLFVNLPIRDLVAAALRRPVGEIPASRGAGRAGTLRQGEVRALDRAASGTSLGRTFMACSPRYPVIRVRVHSGEAYIAPTENLIHDGSSVEIVGQDVSLSLREGP
jgi:hypothetical protein